LERGERDQVSNRSALAAEEADSMNLVAVGSTDGGFGLLPDRVMQVMVRREQPADLTMIRDVHRAAFPSEDEARLVDRLRENGKALISLVAEVDGRILGHILFSPVSIETVPAITAGLGLAPVSVLPEFQRRGIGSRLVQDGLAVAFRSDYEFVVVLGKPSFYRRFGFCQASTLGLRNEYGAEEGFMVIELRPGVLPQNGGLVKYRAEFAGLTE
jgi:putative acetyltransferase